MRVVTGASVAAVDIRALGVRATVVQRLIGALVHVRARESVSVESRFTFASEISVSVDTNRVRATFVFAHLSC